MKMTVSQDAASCILVDVDGRVRTLYFITQTMKAVSSSKTLVNIYQTTGCNIQENSHLTSKFGSTL
jgi:hypothetical protein